MNHTPNATLDLVLSSLLATFVVAMALVALCLSAVAGWYVGSALVALLEALS